MDSCRGWLLLLLLALFAAFDLKLVSADASVQIPHAQHVEFANSGLEKQTDPDLAYTDAVKGFEHLQSQLQDLEATLKVKYSSLQDKEKRISFLESQLADVQDKGRGNVEERLLVAQDTESKLKAQVEMLQRDIGMLESELQTFTTLAESSEATITELLKKNFEATKIDEEQKKRIQSTEEALRKAEAALQQAVSKLEIKTEELAKVSEAWLPLWLVNLPDQFQELAIVEWGEHGEPIVAFLLKEWGEHGEPVVTFLVKEWGEHGEPIVAFIVKEWGEHGEPIVAFLVKEWGEHGEPVLAFVSKEWSEHGEPVVTFLSEKVSQISGAAQETFKETLVPAAKRHWDNAAVVIGPHIGMVKVKVVEEWGEHGEPVVTFLSEKAYQISATAQPHLDTIKELVKEKLGPYADKVAVFIEPYVTSTRNFYGPSFTKAHNIYQRLLQWTTTYHLRLQTYLQEKIMKYDRLAALASKEMIWFLASALLLLPLLGILLVFSSSFGGKTNKKPARSSGASRSGGPHKKTRSK